VRRRTLLRQAALSGPAAALGLSAPRLAAAQGQRTVRFVPQADIAITDPHTTTGIVTRNHAFMVFDTLYGVDAELRPQPQMVESHAVEEGGRRWTMALRGGLRFHDGEPVRARDAVASIRRWSGRNSFANALMAVVDELSAPDDRTILWRLKRPFPMLPRCSATPAPPAPRSCRSGWRAPTWRRWWARWWAAGRSASWPTSASPAPAPCTCASTATRRAPAGRRASWPAPRSPTWTAWSGCTSRTRPPRPRRCSAARSTGGSSPRPTCCPCCVGRAAWRWRCWTRPAPWACCGSTTRSRPSATRRCAAPSWGRSARPTR
jgi:hypothetical protein